MGKRGKLMLAAALLSALVISAIASGGVLFEAFCRAHGGMLIESQCIVIRIKQ